MPFPKDQDLLPAFENFDLWSAGLPENRRALVENHFKFTAPEDLEEERKHFLNVALISQRTGHDAEEVSRNLETLYIPAFSKDERGLNLSVLPKDAGEFYQQAKSKLFDEKDERDTSIEGAMAALRGEDVVPALQAWQQKNGLERMPKSTAFTKGFLHAQESISGFGVSDAVDAHQRAMQGAPKEGDEEMLRDFEALLLDLPEAKRKTVLTAAAMMAQARSEKAVKGIGARESGPMGGAGSAINAVTGFFQEVGESGGRFAGKLGGIAKDEELDAMANLPALPVLTDAAKARHPLATGVAYTSTEKIDTAEKAADFIKEWKVTNFGTASADVTRADIEESDQTAKKYRQLDDGEKKLIESAQKRELKKNQIARELRAIAESSDPVGPISGAIGSSVAMAAANILTRGKTLPISWQLYSEANYDQLRLENPSLAPSEARAISRVSGAGEAALDALEIGILRKLPSVAAVLKSGTSAAWRNAGTRLGATFAFEQFQEGVQDLTLPFTRALFEAVGRDTGLDMTAEWERWKDSRGTVAIASIPLILLGAGIATHQDIKDAKNSLSSRDRLGEQGISEADAVPIIEAARAGKMDEAQALYRDAFKRRSPEVAAEYQAKLETQQKAVAEAVVEVTRLGLIPEYTLLPGGKVVVTDLNDGSKATFDSWRDAQPVIEQSMNEMERINNDSILRIADDILQRGEEVTVSPRSSESLAARVRGGSMSPEEAIRAAIAANIIKGVSVDEARKIAEDVFGESREERIKVMRDAVERSIVLGSNVTQGGESKSKLFKGANLTTLIEETSEGRLKEGLRLGRYKKNDWLRLIQQAEEATGEKFLIGSTSDAVNASPDFAPRELVEAVSRIVVADVLGRLKDGRRIGSGSITKSLEENNSLLVAWIRAFKRLLASVLQTAKRIREARNLGKLGDEYDAYIDDLLGVDQQAKHETAVADAVAAEMADTSGYSEESPGPNGETFSVREMETEYMAAVEAGDVAKQQAMVDAAAKAAGYDVPWFHGSPVKVTEFALPTANDIKGYYFTKKEDYAKKYGPNLHKVALRYENVLDLREDSSGPLLQNMAAALVELGVDISPKAMRFIQQELDDGEWVISPKEGEVLPSSGYEIIRLLADAANHSRNQARQQYASDNGYTPEAWQEAENKHPKDTGWQLVTEAIQRMGFDAILRPEYSSGTALIKSGVDPQSVIVFDPNQIKSADPITRDANGNVIPLSQRFNPERNEITFSLRKFPVPPGLAEAAQKARGESSLILAYQAAQRGSSSVMVPIKAVYEAAKKHSPALTPAAFMAQINALNESGSVLIGLSETTKAVDEAGAFRVGAAGTEMAFAPQETFSLVTPTQDAEYAKAVADGDMETAQAMVDAAAKAAGYDVGPVWHGSPGTFVAFAKDKLGSLTKAASAKMAFFFASEKRNSMHYAAQWQEQNGMSLESLQALSLRQGEESLLRQRIKDGKAEPEVISAVEAVDLFRQKFPGSMAKTNDMLEYLAKIDLPYKIKDGTLWIYPFYGGSKAYDTVSIDRSAIIRAIFQDAALQLSQRIGEQSGRRPSVKPFYLKGKTKTISFGGSGTVGKMAKAVSTAQMEGFDVLEVTDTKDPFPTNVYAVFNPNQIKSADPITRDADGNVIPLSQRFNPDRNEITFSLRKFPVPPGLAEAAQKARGESSLILAYQAAQRGSSSAMVPIRAVYEQAKKHSPALTPAQFMAQINALNEAGSVLIGLSETTKAVEDAGAFRVGAAGTEMAFAPQETFSLGGRRDFMKGLAASLMFSQHADAGPSLGDAMKGVGTKLTSEEEAKFQQWKAKYAPLDSGSDYDLRGAFKEGITPGGERGHFPDTYKLPNHPTFSKESKYSTPEHPGGEWGERNGHTTFTPSLWMAGDADRMEELKKYFKEVEPDAELIMPDAGSTFSLRSGDFASRMAAAFSPFQRNPELRMAIAQVAKQRAQKLGAEWVEKAAALRSASSITGESRVREALAYEARMNEYLDGLTPNARQTLEFEPASLEDDPLIAAMLDHGKLMSRTTARKLGKVEAKSGDYDGAPWLPPAWYSKGAGIMPDQMAQAMHDAGLLPDAYTDTLWEAIASRIASTKKDKAAHREAVTAYKAAQKYARDASKAEAEQWAEKATKAAGSPKAQREALKAALRTLDGILSAAPPEVRAKVGGYVKLAGLATDEAMLQEIERRIAKLNVELEKWLKKEYLQRIAKLFKRFAPKKDDKGRITSNITAEAAEDIGFAFDFASLDDANQEKEMAAIEKTLEESEDAAEIQDAIGKLAIVQLFHKLEKRESSELEAAAMWIDELGSGAREARKIIDAARAEWVKEAKDAAKADASNGKLSSLPDAENVEADVRSSTFKRFTNDVKGFLNSALFTMGQQLEIVFGQDSRITTEFHRRAVRAANDSTDIKRDIEARREAFVADLFGTSSRIKQAGRMGALTVPSASGVIIATGGKAKTIDVPADVILRIIEGTADLKALGFTKDEAATLANAWADNAALPVKRQKRVFQIERRGEGKDVELTMSQDEAIQYLLWSNQKASREQMERDGWSEESFQQLSAFLSDDARALASFFADEYARLGRLINPVYRRMFNAPFPQVDNYSPIFRDISKADSIIDIDQQGHGSGVSSGFILARNKNARSALRRTSAISAFMQHAQSAAHWIAHVELVRDLRSVLIDKEVQNAIRSNGRTAAANGIKKRVMQLENQGKVGAAGIAELDSWGSRLLQARAFKGLAWRISPVMKQASAYFNPLLADVPAWDYMRGTARLLSGQLDVSAMWNSPDIQRRIEMGFSAESRIAMDKLGYTGSTLLAAMGKGMLPMTLMDAGWTTAGAAIAFDYYRRNNVKSGMNEAQAESAALDQLEMMIAESAQPADPANRSLIEGLQNPWLKSMWMFASESRKTLAVEIMALRRLATGKSKNKAMDVQRAVVAHVVMATTTQLMAGILSLLMGDDDDREREWSVEEWASAIVAGPINGLFLFGDAFNYVGRRLFGLHAFEPSTAIGQAVKTVSYAPSNLDKVINGEPEEQRKAFLRLSEALGQAAAIVGPGNPFTAADVILGNPLKDAEKILSRVEE